jgi:hypothetical protein
MPTPTIVEIPEDKDVVCPICNAPVIDDEGLVEQPSCEHILFVYANAEAFEYDAEGFEERLNAAQEKADEAGDYFDEWEWLSAQCDKGDVILQQDSDGIACGPVSFRVWIGIRRAPEDFISRHRPIEADREFSPLDCSKYFHPTAQFVRWMKEHHSTQHIYDVGAGVGQVSSVLAKAGLQMTALDLEPRHESEFPVSQADSTEYQFERDSVVMLCRPCHENGFVRDTILRALNCGVRVIVYVGLQRNVREDLGGYYRQFVKRRIRNIGHADEHLWEMTVSRLQANANLRRGAIPPL